MSLVPGQGHCKLLRSNPFVAHRGRTRTHTDRALRLRAQSAPTPSPETHGGGAERACRSRRRATRWKNRALAPTLALTLALLLAPTLTHKNWPSSGGSRARAARPDGLPEARVDTRPSRCARISSSTRKREARLVANGHHLRVLVSVCVSSRPCVCGGECGKAHPLVIIPSGGG